MADKVDVEETGCAEGLEMKINKDEENVGDETSEGHEQHEVKFEVDMEKKEIVDEGAIEVKLEVDMEKKENVDEGAIEVKTKVEDEECSVARPPKIKLLVRGDLLS